MPSGRSLCDTLEKAKPWGQNQVSGYKRGGATNVTRGTFGGDGNVLHPNYSSVGYTTVKFAKTHSTIYTL